MRKQLIAGISVMNKLVLDISEFIEEQAELLPLIVSKEISVTLTVDGVTKAKFKEKDGCWNIVEV